MDKFVSKSKELLKNLEAEKEKLKKKLEDKYEKYKVEKKQKELAALSSSDAIFKKKLHSKTFSLLAQTLLSIKPEEKPLKSYDLSLYYKEMRQPLSVLLKEQYLKVGFLDFHSESLKNIIQNYYRPKNPVGPPLLHCISVIGFHHKKGSIVEFIYPESLLPEFEGFLTTVALPDAVHQNDDDYVYFTYLKGKTVFYGVSCFKQIPVSEEMKLQDKELTRGFLQKAVCIVSEIPLFGSIMSKLEPITKAYFKQNNFKDNEILQTVYNNINSAHKETCNNLDYSELFFGFSLRNLLYNFKEKVLVVFKAIILEKRVLIYSNKPSAVSNFILSILALLPGGLHFTMDNSSINLVEAGLSDFALPLRIFNNKAQLLLYFTINNFDLFEELDGYLLGTTNSMIKGHKKAKPDIIIDLDQQKIEIFDEKLRKALALNDKEKEFVNGIIKKVSANISEDEKKSLRNFELLKSLNPEWEGSEDWIRQEFSKYLKTMLSELALFISFLKTHRQFKTKSIATLKKKNSNPSLSPTNSSAKAQPDGDLPNNPGIFFDCEESDEEEFEGYISRSFAHVDKKLLLEELAILKQEKVQRKQVMRTLKRFNLKWLLLWSHTVNFQYWLQHHNPLISNLSSNQPSFVEKELVLFENGDIYLGGLAKGNKHGNGLLYERANRLLFNGNWENNEKKGAGVLNSLNNEYIYDGEFAGSKKHGFGKLITTKLKYSGNFKNDVFSGAGVLIDANQDIYDGEFVNGLKSGMGKWQASNGDQYIGEFQGDLFHGKGQYIFANGDIYSGDFQKGKKSGYGVLQQKSNASYQGEWENDTYHGQGILAREDGTVFQGIFANGALHNLEKSIIKYCNGDNYTGQVAHGVPEGQGIYKYNNGEISEGVFENGVLKEKC